MSTQEVKQRMYALFAVFGVVIFFWFSFHQNGLTLTYFAKEYTDLNLFGMPISAELFPVVESVLCCFPDSCDYGNLCQPAQTWKRAFYS